jgi:very-long-chain (3R)-3-hydroxyacyl-CoA dehydratase
MSLYLTIYNNVTTLLWLGGVGLLIASLVSPSLSTYVNTYFTATQSLMVLDIVHVLLKLAAGSVVTTFLQIVSRLYVAWVVLPAQDSLPVWNYVMFVAWSLAEVIRFQYYVRKNSSGLLFLRYNAFIVLYPMGVLTGELPLLWRDYTTRGRWINIPIMALYIPFFPYLYWHMLVLRKKKSNTKGNGAAAPQKTE